MPALSGALVKLELIGRYTANIARVVVWHLGAYEHQRAGHLLVPASIQYSESFAAEPRQDPHQISPARDAQTSGPVTGGLSSDDYTF